MSSEDLLSQQEVWNDRAKNWDKWGFGEPLSPSEQDLLFQEKYIKLGGSVLALGVTESLCELAMKKASSVTVVDFAPHAEKFCPKGANFVCMDWITFLEGSTEHYDTIVTDNGGTCLEYPSQWHRIADAIHSSLKPGGVFSSRFFVSSENPPKNYYENPNLARIMPAIGRVSLADSWMTVKPASANGERYDARYAFPPIGVVEQTFSQFTIVDRLVPDYEEGEHFVSLALQRAA